jgi:hypothetical protein
MGIYMQLLGRWRDVVTKSRDRPYEPNTDVMARCGMMAPPAGLAVWGAHASALDATIAPDQNFSPMRHFNYQNAIVFGLRLVAIVLSGSKL